MYTPKPYQFTDKTEIRRFLRANSFGILINQVGGKLLGTHIPMELETDHKGQEWLEGHVAKTNPQWKNFAEQGEVLAIFTGPHSYVSSSWYEEEEVPTWNYIAVHVYGKIEVLTNQELLDSLKVLVDKYEAPMENPIKIENLNAQTMQQVRGIVGFKIKITEIQATYKLSQTRTNTEQTRIVSELEKCPHAQAHAVAKAMKKNAKES